LIGFETGGDREGNDVRLWLSEIECARVFRREVFDACFIGLEWKALERRLVEGEERGEEKRRAAPS